MKMLSEIQNEILAAIPAAHTERVKREISIWAEKEDSTGRNFLQIFYKQWKSGKQGHKNPFNSLTAFLLGVTTVKPTGDFDFKRIRVFARPSAPDIDSDFDYEYRDTIVNEKLVPDYGRGCVANVGTIGSLKMRSALTRIIKALDIADAFHEGPQAYTTKSVAKVDEILSTIPPQRGALLKVRDRRGEEVVIKTTSDLISADSDACKDFRFYMEKYPEIFKHAKNIEGLGSIFSCVASDTPILTQKGWARIDQLDKTYKIAYINNAGEKQYTNNYIALKTGYKKCYRMRLSNGNFVDLTDEHIVFTDKGCIVFKEIRENPENYKIISVETGDSHE
jgi:hypothetical protein